jgi:alpha-2-macroglobulin
MIAPARAGMFAALAVLACILAALTAAAAAEKPFQRPGLAEAAISLEAQIKKDAGAVGKPLSQLRREADAAFQRNDLRGGMVLLGQIVAVAPQESANWLRLSRATLQIRPANDRERAVLLDRAATAAFAAYRLAGNRNEEAEALVLLGRSFGERRIWRPALDALRLSLELREVAEVRAQSRGCAKNMVSACSTTPSMPMPPRRAPASSFPSSCRASAPTSRPSSRLPASTAGAVGGRAAALRGGPEARRALQHHPARGLAVDRPRRSRNRRASRSMSATAAVCPLHRSCLCAAAHRSAAAFRWSAVNTAAVAKVAIYRIGDRNLIDTVLG